MADWCISNQFIFPLVPIMRQIFHGEHCSDYNSNAYIQEIAVIKHNLHMLYVASVAGGETWGHTLFPQDDTSLISLCTTNEVSSWI